jgi:hypothetical protein
MSERARIPLVEGNTIRWPFQLKRSGQNAPPNVSLATQILIEWEDSIGTAQTPVTLSSGEIGANWSLALLVAVFSPSNVTAAIGDYPFSLTVFIGGEEVTYERGTLEVSRRYGYPTP